MANEVKVYDYKSSKIIVKHMRVLGERPDTDPEIILQHNNASWAAIIAAKLYEAMYNGDLKAAKIILDRLDGKLVKEHIVQVRPVELKKIKWTELQKNPRNLLDDEIVRPHDAFTPRYYQLPTLQAFDDGIRNFCLVMGRRLGKSMLCWNIMIREAIKTVGNYLWIAPEFAQAKSSVWDSITNDGKSFLSMIPKELVQSTNSQEMLIKLANGSTIRLVGASNTDAIRGSNPRGVVFDEYATISPDTIMVVDPILKVNKGWKMIVSTPRGDNHFKKLYDQTKDDPKWHNEYLSHADLDILSPVELQDIKQEYINLYGNDAMFSQEYLVSWVSPNSGSVYGDLINKLINMGRYKKCPYNPDLPVYTAWDIGFGDHTAIVFFQTDKKRNIFVIDLIERSRMGIKEILQVVSAKPYPVQCHFLPHDAGSGSSQTGTSYEKMMHAQGVKNTQVLKRGSNMKAILNWLRNRFSDITIDENLDRIVECLRGMEYEWNAQSQKWSEKPTHKGGFSDVCMAMVYMAQACSDYIGDKGDYNASLTIKVSQPKGLYGTGKSHSRGGTGLFSW